ncbi:hypothetical protein ASC64_05055 [Nocardioides sp. Root122]|uniref:hypothetical protein n=1 Tax=Nocardioides TaxID=1839 RepID=UPI0007030348|nr:MULTISPECIES: hypothetical protein [Nocardioides]KQV71403.1 hypothetical protein ASC64_05055 [Nocardioides sp. Root122]MCK9822628.1 hypothetical protein [Nocardioides cavernae]
MKHSRRLIGALTTLAALAGAGLATLPAEAAALPIRTVEVAYGDGPVTQASWDEPIDLVFRGEKGDQVGLQARLWPTPMTACEYLTLTGPSGEVTQRMSRFWTLPKDGRYTLSYSQDCVLFAGNDPQARRDEAQLQLMKLRVHDARPGRRTTLAHETGYIDALRVVLRKGQGPLTLPARRWDGVVTPVAQEEPRPFAWGVYDFNDSEPRSFTFTRKARIDEVRVGLGRPFLFYRMDSKTSVVLRNGRS